MEIISEFSRLENENYHSYIWRMDELVQSGKYQNWKEITSMVNKELFNEDESQYRDESAFRKAVKYARDFYEAGVFGNNEDEYFNKLRIEKQELRKEKQKLFDERTGLNKLLREQSRREELFNIVKRAIDEYEPIVFDYSPAPIIDSDSDMIIHVTDVHCGVNIVSPFNTYNFDVLQERLKRYLDEIIEIRETYNSQNAYIILGGDMLHGLIHTNARIEAKENIIEQIKKVSDVIGHFIDELRYKFSNVFVYTTPGNHGRSMASKEEAIRGENFDLLVPYVLSKDFKRVENVFIEENTLDVNIATFNVRGWNVYASHGDKENEKTVVYNMTKLARRAGYPLPDMCYLGHRHTNGLSTVDEVKVIQSGCVDGMDSYAIDGRFVGSPEQTVTVVTQKKRVKALCDIQLD